MLKLFAWEPYTLEKVEQVRDAELQLLQKSRLLETLMYFASDTIPRIAQLIVFAAYVSSSQGIPMLIGYVP